MQLTKLRGESALYAQRVLEIAVGYGTFCDQISKISGQFHIMIRHDDRTSHQHILSYLSVNRLCLVKFVKCATKTKI